MLSSNRASLDQLALEYAWEPIYTGKEHQTPYSFALRQRELLYDYIWIKTEIFLSSLVIKDLLLIAEMEYHYVHRNELLRECHKLLLGKAPIKLFMFKLPSPHHGKTQIRWDYLMYDFLTSISIYDNSEHGEHYVFINTGPHGRAATFVIPAEGGYPMLLREL